MNSLRFLHIPKTAGNTFTSILSRHYPPARTFRFSGEMALDVERFALMTTPAKKSLVLFVGHAPIETGIQEADEADLMTFLRDPITRAKSFCQHVAEGKSAYLIRDFPPDSFDLERFLRSGDGPLSNLQTKMLINRSDLASPSRIESMSPGAARDLALENLFDRVSVYGLQEYFDESLLIFASHFGWPAPYYFSMNQKRTDRLVHFSDHQVELISELNSIDLDVYEMARRRFLEILERSPVDASAVARFRRMNSLLSPGMRAWAHARAVGRYWVERFTMQRTGAPLRHHC